MALSRDAIDVLRPRSWQQTSRIEQVLHDHGVFLVCHHGIPYVRFHIHYNSLDPGSSGPDLLQRWPALL